MLEKKSRFRSRRWAALMLVIAAALIFSLTAASPLQASVTSPVQATATTISVLRSGPGQGYSRVGWMMPGTTFPVIGRNRPANWLKIEYASGQQAWIAAWLCEVSGDLSIVPIVDGSTSSPDSAVENPTPEPTPEPPPGDSAEGFTATVLANLNVRSGPGINYNLLGKAAYQSTVNVLYANQSRTWVIIEYGTGRQGWVFARFLQLHGDINTLPVHDYIFTGGEEAPGTLPTPTGEESSADSDAPSGSAEGDPPANPDGPPPPYEAHLSYVGGAARIYQHGQQLGNNRHRFSQVGDSDTANIFFLRPFDQGSYALAEWDHLQSVINHFSGSFNRQGLAAQAGMSAESLLDPLWANPNVCNEGESSLECEYRVYKPAIALIMVRDGWDAGLGSPYHQDLREIAQISIDHGVIPVFSTLAHQNAPLPPVGPMNESIRATAREFNVPLWDLAQTTQRLKNLGVDDTFHLTVPPSGETTYFREVNLAYGMTRRNLEALQVLHTLLYSAMN